ncbi:MAG: lipid A export permease/ATP-binding protein MsbA [Gammaproteobacteria bacterium]|nr:MAG: lipid A export permease/ATP-binding protein MsbA [Gammaproteobacteria bacterium]
MSGLQVYLRLLSYLRGYIGIFLLSILGLILFSSMEIAFIDLFGYTVNAINSLSGEEGGATVAALDLGKGSTTWMASLLGGEDALADTRWIIPVVMFMIAVVRGVGFFVGGYCMAYVTQILVHNLRVRLFNKYTRLPSRYFDTNMSGHLISRITFHVAQVTQAATSSLKIIIREGALVIGLISYLFYLNWRLAAIFVIVLPVIGTVVGYISKRFRLLSRRIQSSVGNVTHVTQEAVGGYREMHLFGGAEYERRRMSQASNYSRRQHMKMAVAEGLSSPLIQMLVAMSLSGLMWMALDPKVLANMTGGEFVQFLGSAGLLAKPIRQLSEVNSNIQKGIAAAGTIFATLDEEEERDLGTVEKDRVEGHFEFRDVSFAYSSDSGNVLNGINLEVPSGVSIALVGQSGSGKTTLVSLIPRFYNHDEGQILLDGVDVNDYKLDNLRSHIALVSQNVTLFNDTIYNNIAYGALSQCSEEQVREAARAAHALEFIERLPEGFNTQIGDDGVMLSGGQRQRLAIARALLKNAPVLILDEATSALDTESEHHIQRALEQVMQGRTTFVIAHRLSTIENTDRIVVMDKGKIVEQGSHDELLALNGRYAQLHQKQFSDESEQSA